MKRFQLPALAIALGFSFPLIGDTFFNPVLANTYKNKASQIRSFIQNFDSNNADNMSSCDFLNMINNNIGVRFSYDIDGTIIDNYEPTWSEIYNLYLNKREKIAISMLMLNCETIKNNARQEEEAKKAKKELIAKIRSGEINTDSILNNGYSLLTWSIKDDDLELMKELVKAGVDFNLRDKNGNTPLNQAIEEGNLQMVKQLINYGSNVNLVEEGYYSPLQYAYIEASYDDKESFNIFYELIRSGADVNEKDSNGRTLMHHAVRSGDENLVKYLVDNDANIDIKDDEGLSPLFRSIENENNEMAKLLIQLGADVNLPHENDNYLSLSMRKRQIEIVKELIKAGVDINSKIPFSYAYESYPIPMYPSIYTIRAKEYEILALLLKAGADVNVKNEEDISLLAYAVYTKELEIVKALLRMGADVNIINGNGWTISHILSSAWLEIDFDKRINMIKEIINHGVDFSIVDSEGLTALDHAQLGVKWDRSKKFVEIVNILKENGAK